MLAKLVPYLVAPVLPLATLALSTAPAPAAGGESARTEPSPPPPASTERPEQPPVVTEHALRVGERTLRYFATVGTLPIKNEQGETEASLFFTAYTLDVPDGRPERPLMISFNGGPGSSSVWLHLGGLGPKRVRMMDDGAMPAPPFKLDDNEQTWLEATDLVFVDPVDTGYSRAATPELAKKFRGVEGDLAAVGEFVRLYLSRHRRWGSPLFLVGESYGTFRAAGLAGRLIEQGIAFNGIVLVSSILDLLTARFDVGNDLPYVLFLPTYAAIARYHGRLPEDLQGRDLASMLAEVEAWATGPYAAALAMGHALPAAERAATAERLARYTGLSTDYVGRSDLRVQIHRFCKELLREVGRTVGRLDGRYTGFDASGVSETPDFDPSMAAIRPPFTAMLNDHLRATLGYETDAEYHILRGLEWDWGSAETGYAKTSAALADAFARNPYLRLFVASGYYDLATPYFATDYTLNHLPLDPATRGNLQTEKYPVGHMVYLEKDVLAKLKADATEFVAAATAVAGKPLRG